MRYHTMIYHSTCHGGRAEVEGTARHVTAPSGLSAGAGASAAVEARERVSARTYIRPSVRPSAKVSYHINSCIHAMPCCVPSYNLILSDVILSNPILDIRHVPCDLSLCPCATSGSSKR